MATTTFDVLIKTFTEDKISAQEFLSGGGAKDFAQYKEVTGLIRGLQACINYTQDLSRNYMETDDD
tara:strand:+ start:4962 stop:5159 length:198 start_codon:yes stop_codon:yes gene_type:complete